MFFYSEGPENDLGCTFWTDELKFEKLGTIAHPRPAILDGQDQVFSVETGQKLNIGGLKVTCNMPTGIDQSVDQAFSVPIKQRLHRFTDAGSLFRRIVAPQGIDGQHFHASVFQGIDQYPQVFCILPEPVFPGE